MQKEYHVSKYITKIIGYILIQLAALWSIASLLLESGMEGSVDLTGLGITTSIFLLYAYKTIQLLNKSLEKSTNKEKENEKEATCLLSL